ncbi:MAG TPA: methylated-DNA--[protein]-cysteine S-methyltransferase [Burkholderiales bacterium]|nr:methylated-DNA--[protein]-cysteine S-methyltransferase [Burkholderiales bacterium]
MRQAEIQGEYQAKLKTPFAVLGIRHQGECLTRIDFLPRQTRALSPQTFFAAKVCRQLEAYLRDPEARFNLPMKLSGTPYQQRIWRAIQQIPRGRTLTYGEIARKLFSGPRAVGQACGANPIPLVVPCHRVLGSGNLGGFMNCDEGDPLAIKRWLLKHERG